MSTHTLCFEQKYRKISEFLSENFQFLLVKLSNYLNRRVFVMVLSRSTIGSGSRSAISIQRNNLQLRVSSLGVKILIQTVSFEMNRTYIEVCCKHKPYYYVQPKNVFIFTGLFFSVVAGGTLHFY